MIKLRLGLLSGALLSLFACQQPADWENPGVFGYNRLEPHAFFWPHPDKQSAMHAPWGESDYVQCMNGRWQFYYAPTRQQIPAGYYKTRGGERISWQEIQVPGNIELQGFGIPRYLDEEYTFDPDPPFVPDSISSVGIYRRHFEVPQHWEGLQVLLHFGAANSALYVYVNGRKVGYAQGSKTPAEFDITDFLTEGENLLVAEVLRYSDGSYLECQDFWRVSGLERDVFLYALPRFQIFDIEVLAHPDSLYKGGELMVEMQLVNHDRNGHDGQVFAFLYEPDGRLIWQDSLTLSLDGTDRSSIRFEAAFEQVQLWNAEQPVLYTLVSGIESPAGSQWQSIHTGFRRVEISGGLLRLNGEVLTIRGVNRHEHDQFTGRYVSREHMHDDIALMKSLNINAVRAAHYPNHPYWYQLCDRYGLYVVNEANIETHGMKMYAEGISYLSDHPAWTAAYLDRTRRMFERDKNHASVIIWSLGNEAGDGRNFELTYDWLKKRDPWRPVQYEGARLNAHTDIYAPMYARFDRIVAYANVLQDRPMILCEYMHAMGNSEGNLADYWTLFNAYEQVQGGFIWDWADQTFAKTDEFGSLYWAYGGDMGDRALPNDSNFCANGLVAANRSLHPHAHEVKKVYQPISFEALPFSASAIRIGNLHAFRKLDDIEFSWLLTANGDSLRGGSLGTLDLGPGQRMIVDIPLGSYPAHADVYLQLSARLQQDELLLKSGWEMARAQFLVQPGLSASLLQPINPVAAQKGREVSLRHDQEKIVVTAGDAELGFDSRQGHILYYSHAGTPMLHWGAQLSLWRAPTDNDLGNGINLRSAIWREFGSELNVLSLDIEEWPDLSAFRLNFLLGHPEVPVQLRQEFVILADGSLLAHTHFIPLKEALPELLRMGNSFRLPGSLNQLEWFGRGPHESYADRRLSAFVGRYAGEVAQQYHPYVRAQETGNKTDVRWISLTGESGQGLLFGGSPLIYANALALDYALLDHYAERERNNHGGRIRTSDIISLHIDLAQIGVGGDNSWGARTHSRYSMPVRPYSYLWYMTPYNKTSMNASSLHQRYRALMESFWPGASVKNGQANHLYDL